MDVLFLDKTGTLTTNRLSLAAVTASDGWSEADVLRLAAAASDASTQDPLDLAVLAGAGCTGPEGWERTGFVPFDPAAKRSEAAWTTPEGPLAVTKGAPAAIEALTGRAAADGVADLAAAGARVLAVAVRRDGAERWEHAGLVALADTVRDDAGGMLERLHALGIRTVMLTGDSAQTARAVAARLGLTGEVLTADALDAAPAHLAGVAAVAQVLPEHKHLLVTRLQRAGHVVGMTGDGVNDAPALRQAEEGVAVEGATDVATAAAGAVLTRGGLADLVDLVEESRRIHQRSLTYALNVSVKKIEVPVLLAWGVFAWQQFVFTPLLMALLLVANDLVSMAVTADRARPSGRPDRWQTGHVIGGALAVALPMLAVSAGILSAARSWLGLGLDAQRTVAFVTLVLSSQATVYVVRTRRSAWRGRPSRWLAAASLAAVGATALLALAGWLMHPLPPGVLLGICAAVLAGAAVADAAKAVVFRRLGLHTEARAADG
jgi:H+-transporting ATPase